MSRYRVVIMLQAVLLARVAVRADDTRVIEVTVTASSGRSVYIDKGRAAGVMPGQRVVLQPAGAQAVEGIVQAVATDSARVELPALTPLPPPGTPGQVEVPEPPPGPPAAEKPAAGTSSKPPPDHPPWERREPERSPEMPLLAPAYGLSPADRSMRIDGRIFAGIQITGDQGDGRDDDYFIGRLGAWLQATNPFGAGGRFEFAGELDYRAADVSFGGDTEFQPIIDVASYTLGGEVYSPYVLQIGRFYPTDLPELGVIDGAAGAVQFENGVRAGGGFGVYPRPFPDRDWGSDLSLHVFADYNSKEPGLVSAIVAYQHTWHDGDSDRDLILGRVTARPLQQLWLYCSWWVDIYTSGDVLKGPGVDLTQLWAQARYTPRTDTSLALSFSHSTWVETKRRQYEDIPPDVIADGRVNRLTLSGWHDFPNGLRVSGDIGVWNDQNADGVDVRAAVDWNDPTRSWPWLHGEVFYVQGSFNDGPGLRLQARQDFGGVSAYVGYELFAYSATAGGGQADFVRHIAQLGVAWTTGHMRYSLDSSFYFGDGEGAYSVGLFAEYRF